ncbi:MAG: UDP-N-acetylmuramoyl-tripeptide--D-alanyl-D-alanine ligase [Actinomycetota bacterium]|nr:UDP-N-acetylmuramoyl-tripeptide--D-alanyl-D-alanine ligase [Actinomycetota bacterium]
MIALPLVDVARLAGGRLADGADGQALVTGPVVADSRRVVPGALFVAVSGARVDGHEFATAALADGAVAVLASRPVGVPAVVVDDTVLALGRLAHGYLDRLAEPVVIGITGSSGKTSTKDIVGQLLAGAGPTITPEGSFNTEIGLPLTVLRADADTRFLVLENSARGVGHIAYLCEIARPDIAVVLNVGAAHLGEFGSREVVAKAKGELVEGLASDGVAVLNADDPLVLAMRDRTTSRLTTFGLSADADVRAVDVRLDDLARPSFTLATAAGSAGVTMALHGAHQVPNALAAAAVALESGLDIAAIADALAQVVPLSKWRMQVSTRSDGLTVVNDAYNANPDSVRAALQALAAMAAGGRRTSAVLGPMAELGEQSDAAHREIGIAVAHLRIDRLVVVGAAARGIAEGALGAGADRDAVIEVADAAEAAAVLRDGLGRLDVVLVKASRSADLQRVADTLLEAPTSGAGR